MSEVIKFHCEHRQQPIPAFPGFDEMAKIWAHLQELGLVGVDGHGIAYGNISVRADGATFHVTRSGAGARRALTLADIALVTACDFDRNRVLCEGAAVASSESLTHGAVYAAREDVRGVIHCHHGSLWSKALGTLPTTREEVEYGTPAMAREVWRLFNETGVACEKVFAMGGHPGGLVSFESSLGAALDALREQLRAAGSAG